MMVRPLGEDDRSWTAEALIRAWGSTSVARKGGLVEASGLPGYVALVEGEPVGLLTYARQGDEVEIVTIHVEREGVGVGRALMDAVLSEARRTRARRIWLVTTNDNIRAIRFYQRWGMDLVGTDQRRCGRLPEGEAVDPVGGEHGILVRHELEFESPLE